MNSIPFTPPSPVAPSALSTIVSGVYSGSSAPAKPDTNTPQDKTACEAAGGKWYLIGGCSIPGDSKNPVEKIAKNFKSSADFFASLSWTKIVAIILGFMLIGAAIFSFRPVRDTVVTTGKAAAKVAAVA